VVLQNCIGPSKCTLTTNGQSVTPACVATGPSAEGEACTRSRFGDDDCARGLLCVSVNGALACERLCHGDGNCSASARCAGLANDVAGVDGADGYCMPTCTLSGVCGSGRTCADLRQDIDSTMSAPDPFYVCRTVGTSTSNCLRNTDCAAQMVCDPTAGACVALCDASVACMAPASCMPAGLPNGGGVCG
jgi:hypothetical protein